jgi:hypothetical protein
MIQQHTPRDLPKGMQLRLLQRHLHIHVYCSTICNTKLWKQPRLRKCGIYAQWNFTQP